MSRGQIDDAAGRALRCAVVWLLASVAAAGTWWLVAPTGAALTRPAGWSGTFEELLVKVCAAALLPSTAWLWAVTTVTVAGAARGRPRAGGVLRRFVLLACGVALATGAPAPASAAANGGAGTPDPQAADSGRAVIAGLTLPDRAVAPALSPAPPPSAPSVPLPGGGEHVVVRGDSLWSIAASHPTNASVDRRWRAIWAANRDVIGDDPDLILPGQRLTLPTPTDDPRRAR